MEENYRIQELVERKSFNELTKEEKSIVLVEITEQEYNARRLVIEQTRTFLSKGVGFAEPVNDIKQKAALILKEKSKKEKSPVTSIFLYRIPVYIPAAAVLLLLFTLPFSFNSDGKKEYIAKTDTVHRIIYKTDTVVKEKEVIKQVNVPIVKYIKTNGEPVKNVVGLSQGNDRVVTANPETIIENTRLQLEKQSKQTGISAGGTNGLNAFRKQQDFTWY